MDRERAKEDGVQRSREIRYIFGENVSLNDNGLRQTRKTAPIRGPPNLHLHGFQRISGEWNGPRSPEGAISLSVFTLAKEGLERAYDAVLSWFRRDSKERRRVAAERALSCVQTMRFFLREYAAQRKISTGETEPRAAKSFAVVAHIREASCIKRRDGKY